ncbi:hypothetical protein BKA57DRAFT_222589 [Linnemannia elongata]|nr:hypothetical protein BKA57DRAFT_222589 [Linnemannia elongata]
MRQARGLHCRCPFGYRASLVLCLYLDVLFEGGFLYFYFFVPFFHATTFFFFLLCLSLSLTLTFTLVLSLSLTLALSLLSSFSLFHPLFHHSSPIPFSLSSLFVHSLHFFLVLLLSS